MKLTTDHVIATLEAYFTGKSEISAVYLFGSYARGLQRPDSDVDIALLFENADPAKVSEYTDAHYLAIARILRKELHLVPLNRAPERLLNQIFSRGQCILVNNPKEHAMFKMTAFAKIADFGFYRPKFEEAFTRKLMQE